MTKRHVTLVDDDQDYLSILSEGLGEQYHATPFIDQKKAIDFICNYPTDAVLLDLHLAEESGLTLLRSIRAQKPALPVFVLSGDLSTASVVQALETGCDDFLAKSMCQEELIARINSKVRRSAQESADVIRIANMIINKGSHQVLVDGREVKMTPKEFEFLHLLAINHNKMVPREVILKTLWPEVIVELNNLDTHSSNLRRKLVGVPCRIRSKKRYGYALEDL